MIENRRVQDLPVNGRNALSLVLLAPAVQSGAGPTASGFGDRGTQVSLIRAPRLTKELGISNIEYGWISQAFLIPYTLMFIVSGILIDRYGVKLVYGVATVWWCWR